MWTPEGIVFRDLTMTTFADTFIALLIVAVALLALWFVFSGGLTKRQKGMTTVYDYEMGLRYDRGQLTQALSPGRYPTWPAPVLIERVDMREQTLAVTGQEILTQDNLPVRISATMRWKVTDAIAHKRGCANVTQRLYEAAQIALRRRVGTMTLDALLADRAALDTGLVVDVDVASLGVIVTALEVKDINLVGVAKQAYADLWRAQKEGLAALERARGEQAALRVLANAARVLKGNPELMNLRVLQALQAQPGKIAPTVILGGGPGLVAVSQDPAASAAASPAAPTDPDPA